MLRITMNPNQNFTNYMIQPRQYNDICILLDTVNIYLIIILLSK